MVYAEEKRIDHEVKVLYRLPRECAALWMEHYNPKISRMFPSYLNVELYISLVEGIAYILKYIGKNHISDTVERIFKSGNEQYDGIRHFQDEEYKSAPEALCRLYDMTL